MARGLTNAQIALVGVSAIGRHNITLGTSCKLSAPNCTGGGGRVQTGLFSNVAQQIRSTPR
jgi:hypothetical protein